MVTEQTYNACIKPEGEFCGKRVGPKDVIRLRGGGTGYAGRDGDKAQVKKHFALGALLRGGAAGLRGGQWPLCRPVRARADTLCVVFCVVSRARLQVLATGARTCVASTRGRAATLACSS